MSRDRLIQLIAPIIMLIAFAASGSLLPGILRSADDNVLRYTNASVEGAPPIVVLGTAIAAVRGLIVDYLWIKANAMKEKGLFYEAMADAAMITKLQPRFAAVWSFHGHNMAYNISVATNTPQERWEWVNAGISLVRNEGLRYNPNDLELHRELAFWFAHKIEGVADDAHLYYKRAFCHEWHMVLGPPPEGIPEHLAWIKEVADAPENIAGCELRTPAVTQLLEQLRTWYADTQTHSGLKLDRSFLSDYTMWFEAKQRSAAARLLGVEKYWRENKPRFANYDRIAGDPAYKEAWATLIAHVRKRVLKDEYNMDPAIMYRYEKELGTPIEWRHGQAHALYWSRRGSEFGKGRVSDYDFYISLNNDSQQIQAMQDLARFGRISYDPFSSEMPGRFPDPRWVDVIDRQFEIFYSDARNYALPGAGSDRFINFLKNFMGSAICELYHEGETEKAAKLMKRLDTLFGSGVTGTDVYKQPLDIFVQSITLDQYQAQPHFAPQDIWASLRYGFKVGILTDRPEVLRDSLNFAATVTKWFKENSWNNYIDKYGESRIADIIGQIEDSAEIAYLQLITDSGIKLEQRQAIWANTDRVEAQVIRERPDLLKRPAPALRAMVYDRVMPMLEQQLAGSELSQKFTVDELFPAPPGLEQQRAMLAQRQQEREKKMEEIKKRDPFATKGGG